MRNKHRNLLSAALVMLCIALLAGTAVLLLRTRNLRSASPM